MFTPVHWPRAYGRIPPFHDSPRQDAQTLVVARLPRVAAQKYPFGKGMAPYAVLTMRRHALAVGE
jgi:hypothetical protein